MHLIRFFFILLLLPVVTRAQDIPTLPMGAPAPDFKLPGTDGKNYRLASFKKSKLLVIVFTCNHCPTAQAYEDRIVAFDKKYRSQGVQVVAISPNSPESLRLDECGYTDLTDSYEDMKIRAKDKGFVFPYLFDGTNQAVSKAYGPVATPHVFIFDDKRQLRYTGRFDDTEKPTVTPTHQDAMKAVEALLKGQPVPVEKTKTFGCSVKWAGKVKLVKQEQMELAKETVALKPLDSLGLAQLLKNDSGKLRMVNVWATWCGPCVREFGDFMTIHRMYRNRDFEFVSISADKPETEGKVLKFLKEKGASNANYILKDMNIYKVIEMVDPQWQGALPYTLLIEPGGQRVYGKQGPVGVLDLRKRIVEHRLLGRVY